MSVINHTYNSDKIDSLKSVLQSKVQKGKPADYEIRVDGLAVVSRTNEVGQFDYYKEHVKDFTHTVSVLLYEGQSRNNTHHLFIRQEKPVQQQEWHPYSKLNPDEVILERIAHEKRLWEYQQVQQENLSLKKEIEKLKIGKEELKDTITRFEDKIRSGDKNWGNIVSYGFEAMVKRNVPLIAKIPGMEGIAEYVQNEIQEQQTEYPKLKQKPKIESEFQAKTKVASENPGIAELINKEFDKEKIKSISEILVSLAKKPESIETAKAYLRRQTDKEQIRNIIKKIATQLKGLYNSTLDWVKQKYKLIIFYMKCIKYFKKM